MKKKKKWISATIALIAVVAIIGIWFGFSANNAIGKTTTNTITDTNIVNEGGSGKVTIIEYSDFQCSFCAKALPVLNQIKETYEDKVEIIYKH
ncbi:thioredoxin domain-containing protein, partial [Candidatus Woesearchaeota archaeon]|nr:thioredoxin domain-containing protein [Candidatus Woesearchaeota archaeon]